VDSGETAIVEAPSRPAPKGQNRRSPDKPGPIAGTLDEETRLLRSGLAAERSGDLAGAAASFEQLLSRHPQSPLAPEARAALARVKARRDR
jgi:TolA-binding protein